MVLAPGSANSASCGTWLHHHQAPFIVVAFICFTGGTPIINHGVAQEMAILTPLRVADCPDITANVWSVYLSHQSCSMGPGHAFFVQCGSTSHFKTYSDFQSEGSQTSPVFNA